MGLIPRDRIAKIILGLGGLFVVSRNATKETGTGATAGEPGGRIEDIADAIQKMEGWFPGSVSYQNNNPGNLRYVGHVAFGGIQTSMGIKNFSKFDSYADGRKALIWQIKSYADRGVSFREFLNAYAPSSDNNDPENYSNFVANWVGADPDEKLSAWV